MPDDGDRFVEALEAGDLPALRRLPKADLHNHFFLGGGREDVRRLRGASIPQLARPLRSMDEMHAWVGAHVGAIFEGREGRLLAFEACLAQARRDGVTVLETGEDVWALEAVHGDDLDALVAALHAVRDRVAPGLDLLLEIGLSRHCPIAELERWAAPFLERSELFSSVDLSGDERGQPIAAFRRLYRAAKDRGLRLKAHVGEWGDADSVMEAVETLELDEVQHGIAAATSPRVLRWLAEQRIQLNVCPTSNVMLGRVPRLEDHPIRRLFDAGVPLTINTDDALVFGNGVSEELLAVHRAGLLGARELDLVRRRGLESRARAAPPR